MTKNWNFVVYSLVVVIFLNDPFTASGQRGGSLDDCSARGAQWRLSNDTDSITTAGNSAILPLQQGEGEAYRSIGCAGVVHTNALTGATRWELDLLDFPTQAVSDQRGSTDPGTKHLNLLGQTTRLDQSQGKILDCVPSVLDSTRPLIAASTSNYQVFQTRFSAAFGVDFTPVATIVSGTGGERGLQDGGPDIARFYSSSLYLADYASKYLLVLETDAGCIRVIDRTGVVTTVSSWRPCLQDPESESPVPPEPNGIAVWRQPSTGTIFVLLVEKREWGSSATQMRVLNVEEVDASSSAGTVAPVTLTERQLVPYNGVTTFSLDWIRIDISGVLMLGANMRSCKMLVIYLAEAEQQQQQGGSSGGGDVLNPDGITNVQIDLGNENIPCYGTRWIGGGFWRHTADMQNLSHRKANVIAFNGDQIATEGNNNMFEYFPACYSSLTGDGGGGTATTTENPTSPTMPPTTTTSIADQSSSGGNSDNGQQIVVVAPGTSSSINTIVIIVVVFFLIVIVVLVVLFCRLQRSHKKKQKSKKKAAARARELELDEERRRGAAYHIEGNGGNQSGSEKYVTFGTSSADSPPSSPSHLQFAQHYQQDQLTENSGRNLLSGGGRYDSAGSGTYPNSGSENYTEMQVMNNTRMKMQQPQQQQLLTPPPQQHLPAHHQQQQKQTGGVGRQASPGDGPPLGAADGTFNTSHYSNASQTTNDDPRLSGSQRHHRQELKHAFAAANGSALRPQGSNASFGSGAGGAGSGDYGRFKTSEEVNKYELIMEGKWQRGQLLGRGANGSVYSVLLFDGTQVAVKEIPVSLTRSEEDLAKVQQEISLMRSVEHPHVLRYFAATYDPQDMRLEIFTELVEGGSFGSVVRSLPVYLPEQNARICIAQCIDALACIHSMGIVHRDVKADNILLTLDGTCKIADFGASKAINAGGAGGGIGNSSTVAFSTCIGTPIFMAPEVLTGGIEEDLDDDGGQLDPSIKLTDSGEIAGGKKSGYGRKADVWSLGITCLEILGKGRSPWPEFTSHGHAVLHMANPNSKPRFPERNDLSDDCVDFITQCLTRNPRDRPSSAELLQHPWISAGLRRQNSNENYNNDKGGFTGTNFRQSIPSPTSKVKGGENTPDESVVVIDVNNNAEPAEDEARTRSGSTPSGALAEDGGSSCRHGGGAGTDGHQPPDMLVDGESSGAFGTQSSSQGARTTYLSAKTNTSTGSSWAGSVLNDLPTDALPETLRRSLLKNSLSPTAATSRSPNHSRGSPSATTFATTSEGGHAGPLDV